MCTFHFQLNKETAKASNLKICQRTQNHGEKARNQPVKAWSKVMASDAQSILLKVKGGATPEPWSTPIQRCTWLVAQVSPDETHINQAEEAAHTSKLVKSTHHMLGISLSLWKQRRKMLHSEPPPHLLVQTKLLPVENHCLERQTDRQRKLTKYYWPKKHQTQKF